MAGTQTEAFRRLQQGCKKAQQLRGSLRTEPRVALPLLWVGSWQSRVQDWEVCLPLPPSFKYAYAHIVKDRLQIKSFKKEKKKDLFWFSINISLKLCLSVLGSETVFHLRWPTFDNTTCLCHSQMFWATVIAVSERRLLHSNQTHYICSSFHDSNIKAPTGSLEPIPHDFTLWLSYWCIRMGS